MVLVTNLLTKVAQMFSQRFGQIVKFRFSSKTDVTSIWDTQGKIGLHIIITSGHKGPLFVTM